ncbi:MAG: type secretion system protein VirD4 [Blastocatellia bacterium]|jgi:type IV secretion system protein VirD4|nr:type secretion system protein VirD4 [Blastocatellia bacterium]
MNFVKFIENYDSKYGIPRPAEYPHIPPFHAFLRIIQHVVLMIAVIGCGLISAYLLWKSAGFLHVTQQVKLYFVMGIILVVTIGLAEAAHEVMPYYRIKQRLTYGTARWADESYLRSTQLALKLGPNLEGLDRGSIRIGLLRKGYHLVLNEIEWLRHIVIFGPPGSGKSTTFLMNILRDVSRGASAIVLDPKGELYEQTAHYFNDVYRLDLLNPESSDRWNFVPDCKGDSEFASQMAATIIGLEGTKHSVADPFWQESENLLLTSVLLHLADKIPEPTPPMIYEYLGMRDLKAIDGEMTNSKNKEVRLAWGAFDKAPPQTQGSVITGLMNKLQAFEIKNAQAVCAPISESDRLAGVRKIDFRKLRRPGTAIFVVVAEGDATRYKNFLSTFFGQAVNQLRLDKKKIKNPAPVMFCLDEAANVPIVGLKEIAGVGRGRKIGLTLGYQNMPQVQDQYGHDGANAILGSIGTTIALPGLDDATSQFIARRLGQLTTWSRTTIDAHGKAGDSERASETGRALMDPTELRQMVKHKQCVVLIDTAPPIKAAYPEYAVRKERAVADDYGMPKPVSLLEAEEKARVENAVGMAPELTSIVAEGEAAAGFVSAPDEAAAGTGAYRLGADGTPGIGDGIYKTVFEKLIQGLLPEDCTLEDQSPLALMLVTVFREGDIKSWEDVKRLDLHSRRPVVAGKESVPAADIDSEGPLPTDADVTGVAGLGGMVESPKPHKSKPSKPGTGSNGKSAQQYLFYSNKQVEGEFEKAAGEAVRETPYTMPVAVPSASLLEKAATLRPNANAALGGDALR